MFTMIRIKDTIALLIVCCLLFGSLTLSSCSSQNNLTRRDRVANSESKIRGKYPKNDRVLLDPMKSGASWRSIWVARIVSFFASTGTLALFSTKGFWASGATLVASNVVGVGAGWLAGSAWNKYLNGGSALSIWHALPGALLSDAVFIVNRLYKEKYYNLDNKDESKKDGKERWWISKKYDEWFSTRPPEGKNFAFRFFKGETAKGTGKEKDGKGEGKEKEGDEIKNKNSSGNGSNSSSAIK